MELVLIRGLPGSGKTTMAREKFPRHYLCEADMFFEDEDGSYQYNPSLIKDAHEYCLARAQNALMSGLSVVVANTFTRRWEMQPYFDLAKTYGIELRIIEATGTWPNVHGVPQAAIEKMRQRWEEI